MRIVGEIPHPDIKITIFSWNGKYLIKLEKGPLEQTFKVSEMDLTGERDIKTMLDDEFLNKANARFDEMYETLQKAMEKVL